MRQLKVKSALVSLCEAFPTDHNGDIVRGHAIIIPGTFSTLNELWYALSKAIGSSRINRDGKPFNISDITDDGFLLRYDRLVDHDEKEPSPERLNKWEDGKAQLFNARYDIEISCLEVHSPGAQAIGKMLGVYVPVSEDAEIAGD